MKNAEKAKMMVELFEKMPHHMQMQKLEEAEQIVKTQEDQARLFELAMVQADIDPNKIQLALAKYKAS